jgi:hypothetical protein
MPFTNSGKHIMLDALAAVIDEVSLHSASPSTTGANELSGGSYARKSASWAASASGEKALSSQIVFDVPAGATVAYVGFWDGATFVGSAQVTSETFGGAGTYTLTTGTKLDINDS